MRTEIVEGGTLTHGYSDETWVAVKDELLDFVKGGPKRPGDLEDRFCGIPTVRELVCDPQGRWRASPYYPALGRLVSQGTVKWKQDEEGVVWYYTES
jgi:hypothetical protein